MNKLLAAVVAGLFALSTAPGVLAAKHEMKSGTTTTDAKTTKKKGEQKKMTKGAEKKTDGKTKSGATKTDGKTKSGEKKMQK